LFALFALAGVIMIAVGIGDLPFPDAVTDAVRDAVRNVTNVTADIVGEAGGGEEEAGVEAGAEAGPSNVGAGVVLIVVTLLSLYYMWGFATVRRIAAALNMLDGEVATFKEANEKCVNPY
jgi:hypothetical protein